MTFHSHALVTAVMLSGLAFAGNPVASLDVVPAPRKQEVERYRHLWEHSPFTSPRRDKPVAQPELMSGWTLAGVSEIEGGYMVTILRRGSPRESQVIRPTGTTWNLPDRTTDLAPGAPGTFTIDRVDFGRASWSGTVVHFSADGRAGSLMFEKETPPAKPGPTATPPPGKRPPVLPRVNLK